MIYPEFLKENDIIGICAPSAGVGRKLDDYKEAIEVIKDNGYRILETASVRVDSSRSTTGKKRAKEFEELLTDEKVKMIFFAVGGDYMLEMMPYVDFEKIRENPKLMCGMSDPTNLLFTTTINCDMATMYGFNAGSFIKNTPDDQKVCLEYIKGNLIKQKSYKKYITCEEHFSGQTEKTHDVKWISKKDLHLKGRCIGGCLESIDKLMSTDMDKVKEYVERYKDDGIIWYFDVFSYNSYQFYLTLLQMKMAGYFKYCKGVLFGRMAFPHVEDESMNYEQAVNKVLGKIPYIMEMDIGHTIPGMTMINGAIIDVTCKDGKGSIRFELK
ncbi:MAG: LD-carboxypeptidase [Erysipelotrichaceae bacterium]|nr:LD-carboxypeptidase [Erysipelotrichaceae bacterium]